MPDDPRAPPEAACAEKWRVIRSALDNWGRTTRLCVIYLTVNVPVDILIWLVKHLPAGARRRSAPAFYLLNYLLNGTPGRSVQVGRSHFFRPP